MTDLPSPFLVPNHEVTDSPVGDETVLLHLGNGTYYGLDPMGTRVWALLKEGLDVDAIRDQLCAHYQVQPERAEADLRRFLADLRQHGILLDGEPS